MGKYLDIIERAAAERVGETRRCDQSDLSDKSPPIGRLSRLGRTLTTLECRCPDLVPTERWQQAVADGQRFLARWDKQAHALGWTAKDLFGLYPMSAHAKPSFNRLARYDEIGLIWLLDGREVVVRDRNPVAQVRPRLDQTEVQAEATHRYVAQLPEVLSREEWLAKYGEGQTTLQ